jgi:hypothetical protein
MDGFARTLPGALALACAAAAAGEAPLSVDPREADAHRIGRAPVVRVPWLDQSSEWSPGWLFMISVDATGKVTGTKIDENNSSPRLRDEATRAVAAMRFRPFRRDGRAVPAEVVYMFAAQAPDYDGPADRSFPAHPDPAQWRIALRRTPCFGSCPAYRVELRGDGEVTYRGVSDVLVTGEQHWRVPAASVAPLLEQLRAAHWLRLAGRYATDATDLPTQTTTLIVGDRRKVVVDYGGETTGALASTSTGAPGVPMPRAVTQVERAIDDIAGTGSWTRGDEHTMARLREAGWDFHSADAGRALTQLVGDCQVSLAQDFLRAGAPLDTERRSGFQIGLAEGAARCGDTGLVATLESRGLLADGAAAQSFLEGSVRSGHPDFVALGLKHGAQATHTDRVGTTLVAEAARVVGDDHDPHGDATFDPVRVIALLLAAGAPCDSPDREGNRPLHWVADAAIARALIAAGADPNARNATGQTPLFTQYAAEAIPVLLAAGADLKARDRQGRTVLHDRDQPKAVAALIKAGADIEATDPQGRTPLETALYEPVALLLLDAGARLPTDPARRAALVDHATKARWTKLLARLGPPAS